ncbi:protein-disulfide isomerase [Candidatus Nitrosotenuis chungbukensis]|uniref:hypothetical protein n=1 Tax=Candidatus Nitrosotenuis chungbukensis TaxID=1353246 RepID=UPI00069458F7|nr:hypothetical protein [Candidatus Nitrosotenuis chungbukensis]WKT57347.1 protein-disulfide isomerase [Candidatus Nitrosotenuis chungbukensis]
MRKSHLVIIALAGIAISGTTIMIYLNSLQPSTLEKTAKTSPGNAPTTLKQNTGSNMPDVPSGSVLRDAHEHASILVKIFGDKFDFSSIQFQLMSPWIHFEGANGNTIHRHSKGITLGYLFDTLYLGLSQDCFVSHDKREFCTNDDYELKFYINGEKVPDIRDYEIFDNDRILISYGSETPEEIEEQLAELESQELFD